MDAWTRRLWAFSIAAICTSWPSAGQVQDATPQPPSSAPQGPETGTLVFVPPEIGLPTSRVGAGTRGSEGHTGLIVLLVPEGGGLTTLDKPPLIWRATDDFQGRMQAEVIDLSPDGRGVSRAVEGRFRRGFYALDLGRSEMSMAPGRIYRWTVTATEADSGKVLASASDLVERIEGPAPNPDQPLDTARAAAERGLWFDALAPLFVITLGGQARLTEPQAFRDLATSAGLPDAGIPSE